MEPGSGRATDGATPAARIKTATAVEARIISKCRKKFKGSVEKISDGR